MDEAKIKEVNEGEDKLRGKRKEKNKRYGQMLKMAISK